jgi:hypothetical protein
VILGRHAGGRDFFRDNGGATPVMSLECADARHRIIKFRCPGLKKVLGSREAIL